jgi:hypothetical protein
MLLRLSLVLALLLAGNVLLLKTAPPTAAGKSLNSLKNQPMTEISAPESEPSSSLKRCFAHPRF